MTETAKTKLTILADFLAKKVKPKWFYLKTWASTGFKEQKCGTTACAGGWATMAFPNQGLELHGDDSYTLSYENHSGFHALAAFFDVDLLTAHYLFASSEYQEERSKNFVIQRIRQVVKTEIAWDNWKKCEFPIQAWTQQ